MRHNTYLIKRQVKDLVWEMFMVHKCTLENIYMSHYKNKFLNDSIMSQSFIFESRISTSTT